MSKRKVRVVTVTNTSLESRKWIGRSSQGLMSKHDSLRGSSGTRSVHNQSQISPGWRSRLDSRVILSLLEDLLKSKKSLSSLLASSHSLWGNDIVLVVVVGTSVKLNNVGDRRKLGNIMKQAILRLVNKFKR